MLTLRKTIEGLTTIIIYALAFFLPLIFSPFTSEYFDTAKLIFLGSASLLLLLLWVARGYTEAKVSVVKTPLDILFLLLLVVAFLSTVLSPTPYPSLYGLLPKVHGSLIFISTLVLTYFMIVSNVKNLIQVRTVIYLLVLSGIVVSLVSLLSFFQIYLPWKAVATATFSLAGSTLSTAVFLTMILPLSLTIALQQKKLMLIGPYEVAGYLAFTLFVLVIMLVGNLGVWIGAAVAIGLTLFFHKPNRDQIGVLGGIGALALIIAILAYTPTLKTKTELGKLEGMFQKDIQLSIGDSWKISAGAFRDSPILGTGPATYLYNFTQYKPLEINQTDLWDKKINSAHDQYLQTLAELGGAGLLILLFISVNFIFMVMRILRSGTSGSSGLGLAGVTFLLMMALSPMSVLTEGLGIILIALFLSSLRDRHHQVRLMELNLNSGYGGVHPLIPSLIFVPVLALVLAGFFFLGKLSIGEYYHRQFLKAASVNNGKAAYDALVLAEQKNPEVDLYRVDLANTNFALANSIAAQKGATEASPAGSLTEDDKRTISQLLQQAIAEGRSATTLSPRSSANWEVLANIYRQISGVASNAIQFSLDSYNHALQNDPLNPTLRLAVGQVYYSAKNYDLAVRFYDDAVKLKPDYSNALYNLAVTLRDKGNTTDASSVAERLVAVLQDKPDSDDYKKASALLSEIKEKAMEASSSAALKQEPSALEKSNLKNAVPLPKPENVSTPPAVPQR